jgi:hypothetical protein
MKLFLSFIFIIKLKLYILKVRMYLSFPLYPRQTNINTILPHACSLKAQLPKLPPTQPTQPTKQLGPDSHLP